MTVPDPNQPVGYASITQARAAGAVGTDTEVAAALDSALVTIDRYCRDHFKPDSLTFRIPVDAWGTGYLPVIAYAVDVGTLAYDGRTWTSDGYPPFGGYATETEFDVSGDYGWRTTPAPVIDAAARLAALYSPGPYTPAADAEGNPSGMPPAPTLQDLSDPGPPLQRQGSPADQRTTGDPVVDAWLEPYKSNRVMI
jgi:hypothetical protein